MRKWLLLLAVVLALGSVAAADAADTNPTYYGCVNSKSGVLRVVGKGASCSKSESRISWDRRGPTGPAGPAGAPGSDTGLYLVDQAGHSLPVVNFTTTGYDSPTVVVDGRLWNLQLPTTSADGYALAARYSGQIFYSGPHCTGDLFGEQVVANDTLYNGLDHLTYATTGTASVHGYQSLTDGYSCIDSDDTAGLYLLDLRPVAVPTVNFQGPVTLVHR